MTQSPSRTRQIARSESSRADLERSARVLRRIFANYTPIDFAVRLWDGSTPIAPSRGLPRFTLVLQHPGALRRMFLPPSEVGLGEAYLFNDFTIEGDLFATVGLTDYFQRAGLSLSDYIDIASEVMALPRSSAPMTVRPGLRAHGAAHSRQRDRQTVRFHYDVSNDFYALWLDERMLYSCAYFRTGREDIHLAQRQKLDLICRKLSLRPGDRVLDIGCGWGGLAIFAAQEYGADVTGITLSKPQATLASERIIQAGVEDRCRAVVLDYRDVPIDDPYDKLVSVGMFEHVGAAKLAAYFARAWRLLKPGGLFLNHGIGAMNSHLEHPSLGSLLYRRNSFMNRYVFPDSELVDLHQTLQAAEDVGFEVRDVESLREHYALTLRHWVRRLEDHHEDALRYVDEPTYRVWRLYMAGCSHGFTGNTLNVYQALLSKNTESGSSWLPWTREYLNHR